MRDSLQPSGAPSNGQAPARLSLQWRRDKKSTRRPSSSNGTFTRGARQQAASLRRSDYLFRLQERISIVSQIDSHGQSADVSWLDKVRLWATKHRRRAAASAPPTVSTSAEPGTAISPLDQTLVPLAGISMDYVWNQFVHLFAADQARQIALDEHQQRQPLSLSDITSAMTRMVIDEDPDIGGDDLHTDVASWLQVNQEPSLRPTSKVAALCIWLWHNGLCNESVDIYGKIWNTVRALHHDEDRIGWPPDSALEGFRNAAYSHWDNANHKQFCILFRERHVDPQIDRSLTCLLG